MRKPWPQGFVFALRNTGIGRVGLRLVMLVFAISFASGANADRTQPNFVIILIDDLGWADLGCYGSSFYKTPHIDRLAAGGVRFTDAYAAGPVCSPTRASLLTGRHPARLHLTDWLPGRPDDPSQKLCRPAINHQLPLEEVTLAEALKPAGYICASIGKWHLGGKGFFPEDQGFDQNVAGDALGSPLSYFAPYQSGGRTMPGLAQSQAGEYLTDRLTLEAEKFLETNKDRPFLLYLSHYAVHIPLKAKDPLVERFRNSSRLGLQTNAIYAAMIASVDESVGRITAKLQQLGLSERTIVFFLSDNGGLSVEEGPLTPATSNAPLRAGKGYLFEGGIRVPLIIKGPAAFQTGKDERTPVSSLDLFPTILACAGVAPSNPLDGLSLLPILKGQGALSRDTLYWHYPHYSNQGGKPGGAIRVGDWKLIQFYEDDQLELYNLAVDLSEQANLAAREPARAAAMRVRLEEWRRSVAAQMMMPYREFREPVPGSGTVVRPGPDGLVELHARDAMTHGQTIRYEPQPHKNTIGYWTNARDWVSWELDGISPGEYEVNILQGCGTGSGGSEVAFSMDEETIVVVVEDTGGFQNFKERVIGSFHINEAGRHRLEVKARTKPGLAVMDLRAVTLRPKARRP